MKYNKIKIKGSVSYTAQPESWKDLAYTLHNERPFLKANPQSKEVDQSLLNMFK